MNPWKAGNPRQGSIGVDLFKAVAMIDDINAQWGPKEQVKVNRVGFIDFPWISPDKTWATVGHTRRDQGQTTPV